LKFEIKRSHIVRECRSKCIELGYSGKAFEECVRRCIEESKEGSV